jgi:hypothetical protein
MEKALLIKSVFLFVAIWGLSIVLLWFRPRIELFWKIIASLIFFFYVWFFFEEISKGYNSLLVDWYIVTVDFVRELIALIFVNLFFLWPLSLILIFYKSNEVGAERMLKFMCLLTLILWVIFVVYVYYNKGIDEFLYEKLKEMIPYTKK